MSCVHKFTVYIKWNSADLVVEATAKKCLRKFNCKIQQKSTQFDESKNKKHFSDINITNRSFSIYINFLFYYRCCFGKSWLWGKQGHLSQVVDYQLIAKFISMYSLFVSTDTHSLEHERKKH